MPIPNIPVPRFPNVPQLPGVPALARAGAVVNSVILVAAGAVLAAARLFGQPEWGIFDEAGTALLIGDNVIGVEFKRESRTSDYPIEKGGFAHYNKVQTPFDAKATFTVGGSDAARAAFLATCDKLVQTIALVSLVTPEVTYASATAIHYDYRRNSKNGVTLLLVDVWLMEVRITATTAFGSAQTRAPSGADPVSTGAVQPTAPTPNQFTAAAVKPDALPAVAN